MTSLLLAASLALGAAPAAALEAAAAKVDITPDLKAHRIYLAGFGAVGRRPRGIHDPLYARLLLLKDGEKRVAIASFDLLGLYRRDVEHLRRLSGFEGPDRYLLVAATHQHSGPDTLGLWGPVPGVAGVARRWHEEMKEKVAAALRRLESELVAVELAGFQKAVDPRGLCRDARNPTVIDPYLGALSLRTPKGKTVATLVNWSCHPEVLGPSNRLVTADFPGPLCKRVEAETGGACLFLAGSIGGLMTPDHEPGGENFYESYRIGTEVARLALRGLAEPSARERAPRLFWRSKTALLPVENSRYLLFLPALSFGHELRDARGRELPAGAGYWLALRHAVGALAPESRPWVETEVAVVGVGPARLVGIPGEIFPELVLGGYDGRYRAGHPLVQPENPDPPDLARAPKGPYLRDRIPGPLRLVVGLANDEIGYIVPEYDFKTRKNLTMLPRLPGHHYEETNSIGPAATGILLKAAEELLSAQESQAVRR